MADIAVVAVGTVGGAVVGLATCAFFLALGLPIRIMDIFDAGSTRQCGWAVAIGSTGATLMAGMGWSLGLPSVLMWLVYLLAGMFVGMLASALTETLSVLPQCMDRFGLGEDLRLIAWALVIGKVIGALVGVLLIQ